MNLNVYKIQPHDIEVFKQVIFLFEDVFGMKNFNIPPDEHLSRLLAKNGFMVFAAQVDKEVVGGLTAYILHQYYSTSSYVYIYDLAVKQDLQRKGIGKKLIASIEDYCSSLNVEEIFVQADVEDDYALDFYRSTGGVPEDVVHFSYPLNSKME